MSEIVKEARDFIGYEYKEVNTTGVYASLLIDCYHYFGWVKDDNVPTLPNKTSILRLKRDRHMVNKVELTRLQRKFEAGIEEVELLEKSKKRLGTVVALIIGLLGTAFVAGSVFAVTAEPPRIVLSILLAIPGFIGWGLPCFIYQALVGRETKRVNPMIEAKQDELFNICEKANKLLPK